VAGSSPQLFFFCFCRSGRLLPPIGLRPAGHGRSLGVVLDLGKEFGLSPQTITESETLPGAGDSACLDQRRRWSLAGDQAVLRAPVLDSFYGQPGLESVAQGWPWALLTERAHTSQPWAIELRRQMRFLPFDGLETPADLACFRRATAWTVEARILGAGGADPFVMPPPPPALLRCSWIVAWRPQHRPADIFFLLAAGSAALMAARSGKRALPRAALTQCRPDT